VFTVLVRKKIFTQFSNETTHCPHKISFIQTRIAEGLFISLPPPLWRFVGSIPFFSDPGALLAFVLLPCSSVGEPQLGHYRTNKTVTQ